MLINDFTQKLYNKNLSECSNKEIYFALLHLTKQESAKKSNTYKKKKVYYMELFLVLYTCS